MYRLELNQLGVSRFTPNLELKDFVYRVSVSETGDFVVQSTPNF